MQTRRGYDGFYKVDIVETPDGPREVVRATDSVNVLIYDEARRRLLFVRQPRAAMISDDNPEGMITETVAGRFDVNLSPLALVKKEAQEEAEVTLEDDDITFLNDGVPMALSAGALTERAYLAIAVVREGAYEEQEREFGAPGEGEHIRRVWVSVTELRHMTFADIRSFTLAQHLLQLLDDEG